MASRALRRSEWHSYFEHVSKGLIGERAEIKVNGLTLGEKTEARCLPLIGITYDAKGDLLEITMEGLDHLVHHPALSRSMMAPMAWRVWKSSTPIGVSKLLNW